MGGADAVPIPLHGRKWSVNLTLPPLGAVFLLSGSEPEPEEAALEAEVDESTTRLLEEEEALV